MPRRREVIKRKKERDSKYNSTLIASFINYIMERGKKSTAEGITYDAIKLIEEETGKDGVEVMKTAIENVKPLLEVRSRRVGGATYQVPVEVRAERRLTLAMRWIVMFAKQRNEHSMAERLARELLLAFNGEGPSIKKREDTHRMAEANKAFAHYKW